MTGPALPVGALEGLEFLPEAVVVVDSGGRVVHVNVRAAGLLELDGGVVGKPFVDVLRLTDDSGADVTDQLVPADPEPSRARPVVDRLAERLLIAHLSGARTRPVSMAGRRLEGGGVVLTFRHAGRRERVEAGRSDLIATVSHEIRSPLTSVKGFTRTMLARWDRFSDDQKRQMLATVDEDADRVTRLLTELLDVARIDAGRVQLHRHSANLGVIVQRVVEKAHHHDEGRTISYVAPAELPRVYVDPDKVEQVLTNLVVNALRYAPGSPVEVEVIEHDDAVEVVVADEGPGIPPDQLRYVFGKFSRGRENRRAGTGLGLYITKGLVEAHGGRVWAESRPGEGAQFHVTFPRGARHWGSESGGDPSSSLE